SNHREEGRRGSCCACFGRKGKGCQRKRAEKVGLLLLITNRGLSRRGRIDSAHSLGRRSRKSRPRICGDASQHWFYGRRSVRGTVWIGMEKIGKMGSIISEM